jgi:parallel beta-helix repeat protein
MKKYLLFARPVLLLLLAGIVFITSCKKESVSPGREQDSPASNEETLQRGAPDIIVSTGGSIQAAVNAADPGDIIHIQPGIYREAIVVEKANLKLVGLSNGSNVVVIEDPGGINNGITVRDAGDGFELYHVTIKNFEANGVVMIRADNFVLSHVTTIDCGEYGLWPIRSNHGRIEHCIASGHSDSGIYTGQSNDIALHFNTVFNNTIGLEIENCSDVTATNNQCYNNVAGILVVLLPGLSTTVSSGITVSQNHVYENNKVNTADPADGFEAFVPTGCGILVVGTDHTTVNRNKVQHNQFLGIATVSSTVLGLLAGIPPEAFTGIEPNPDWVSIKDNVVNTNGTVQPPLPFPASDLLWDGSGTHTCWSSNIYNSAIPITLPSCQ